MGRLFSLDSPAYRFMYRAAELSLLNALCIVCCLPVVTIGPAMAALYYVTMKLSRDESPPLIRSFFQAFRDNFRQALPVWLMQLLLGILLVGDILYCIQIRQGGLFGEIMLCVSVLLAVLFLMLSHYLFPLVAKFRNPLVLTFRNALLLSVGHLWGTLLMLAVTLVPLVMIYLYAGLLSWGLLYYLLVGVALTAYLHSRVLVNIFGYYTASQQ